MTVVIDTAEPTSARLTQLKANGLMTIIRYINPLGQAGPKTVKIPEARAIAAAGLRLALVCEGWGDAEGHGGIDRPSGDRDGERCRNYAITVGAPVGAGIYFAVDTDESASRIASLVLPYFQEVKKDLDGHFRVGVYGSGAVCAAVQDAGLAELTWLAQSTGWTGYRSYRDSNRWNLLQQMPMTIAGLDTDPDLINPSRPDIGDFVPFAPGDTTPTVVYDERWLQKALNTLGANPQLNVDGRIGTFTMNAITKQIRKDLGETVS